MSTLHDRLAEANIRMRRIEPGRTEHLRCPKCDGGRTGEESLAVTIDPDGAGAVWVCHRGSCGWKDGAREKNGPGRPQAAPRLPSRPAAYTKPARAPAEADQRPAWLYDAMASRGISRSTVDHFGVYGTRRRFKEHGEVDTIVFPYLAGGELVNRKFRPHPQKNPMLQEPGAEPTLFNVDAIAGAEAVLWVEGEMDVLALYEAGFPHAVTLKDGAPAELRDPKDPKRQDDKRFAALNTHAEILKRVPQFILAGDNDQPGRNLREELARRLGRHRCLIVEWPDGCKDVNETLIQHGAEAVREAIAFARHYPIEGLQTVCIGTLLDHRNAPRPTSLTTGAASTDKILRLPSEGRLIVVTGIPGSGKSSWTRFAMVHVMKEHRRRFAVFSPEMSPWQDFAAGCASIYAGKPFWGMRDVPGMGDEEIVAAEGFLRARLFCLTTDSTDAAPTLDWILAQTEEVILRHGVTDLLVDPWNELEHDRGTVPETEYVGRSLQRLKAFASRHGVNVWIVVHPTKMYPPKPGERIAAPGPYDISGSANWANKADLILTVHRPETVTQLHVMKSRFSRWGSRGNMAELTYDPLTFSYA